MGTNPALLPVFLNKDLLEHKLLLIPLGIVNSSLICITYGCLGFWGLIWF